MIVIQSIVPISPVHTSYNPTMTDKLTVSQCRELLGKVGEDMTDAQIEAERDHMEQLANVVYDQFKAEMKRNPERMRWLLHAHETGEAE